MTGLSRNSTIKAPQIEVWFLGKRWGAYSSS